MRRGFVSLIFILVVASIGCDAARYGRVAPDGQEFARGRLGIFPAEVGRNEEARETIEKTLTELMKDRKTFQEVLNPPVLINDSKTGEKQQLVSEYMRKLLILNFSDPEMSKGIGEALGLDALLFSRVEYWGYSKDKDKDIAKIGMGLILIEAKTGAVLWRAVQYQTREFLLIKPALTEVTRDLLKRMINEMPR